MEMVFTPQDGVALYGLLADNSNDIIIIKTDCHGFVCSASPAMARVGLPQSAQLFGRHLTDIVQPRHAPAIRLRHANAVAGRFDESWEEFAVPVESGERWFEIRMRGVSGERGAISGVLSLMRNIDDRKNVERQLFVATMTDQLTGLTNRRAFTTMLEHMLADRTGGCIAIFDLDHFKAINLRYGQSLGDEVLVAFAGYVRGALRETDIISRIGGESIGVLLPAASPADAEVICRRIVAGIGDLAKGCGADGIPITASAGVARIAGSVDDTLRRAELALTLAKAKGRNRLEMEEAERVR